MSGSSRYFVLLGSINAALAVVLGAFGAHALKARLTPEFLAVFQTGVQYHFYHALGLLAVAAVAARLPDSRPLKWSGIAMCLGIVMFSVSLYLLSLSGIRAFGAVTPFGGLAFIVGWVLLAISVFRS